MLLIAIIGITLITGTLGHDEHSSSLRPKYDSDGSIDCNDSTAFNCTAVQHGICTFESAFLLCPRTCDLCDKNPSTVPCKDHVVSIRCEDLPNPCSDAVGMISCPLFCGLCSNSTSPQLTITAIPDKVTDGFTPDLSVTCLYDGRPVSGISSILSIILSKTASPQDYTFQEVATMSSFDSDHVHLGVLDVGGQVTGHLVQGEESFVSIKWSNPNETATGQYRCEMFGMDASGHPMRVNNARIVVNTNPLNVTTAVARLHQVTLQHEQCLANANQVESVLNITHPELERYKSNISLLEGQLQLQVYNKNIIGQNLTSCVGQMNTCQKQEQNLRHQLDQSRNNVSQCEKDKDACGLILNQTQTELVSSQAREVNLSKMLDSKDLELVFCGIANNNQVRHCQLNLNKTMEMYEKERIKLETCISSQSHVNGRLQSTTDDLARCKSQKAVCNSQVTKNVIDLSQCRTDLTSKDARTKELESQISALSKNLNISSPLNGHRYILSRIENHVNRNEFKSICENVFDGYLAEIDSESEYDFILKFAKANIPTNVASVPKALLGTQGQPGRYYKNPHSNCNLNVSHWEQGEPKSPLVHIDWGNSGQGMGTTVEGSNSPIRFLCEVGTS